MESRLLFYKNKVNNIKYEKQQKQKLIVRKYLDYFHTI